GDDLAGRGAGVAGGAIVRAEVALLAIRCVDDAVAAEVREPAGRRAAVHHAVAADVRLGAQVAFFGGLDGAVAAARTELALGRAASIRRVVVLHAGAQRVGRRRRRRIAAVALLAARSDTVAATGLALRQGVLEPGHRQLVV